MQDAKNYNAWLLTKYNKNFDAASKKDNTNIDMPMRTCFRHEILHLPHEICVGLTNKDGTIFLYHECN